VLELFLRVLIVASFAVLAVSFFWGPARTGVLAGANLAIDLLVLYRVRRGKTAGAALVLALSLWGLTSFSAWQGQGTHDVSMVVLGILMMVASLMRTRWHMALVVSLTLSVVWVLGLAEMHGQSRSSLAHVTGYDDLIVLSVIFIACASIMRTMATRLSSSLARAQASDRNYKEIFNTTHEGLFVLNPDSGAVLDANLAAKNLLGTSSPNLPGRLFADVVFSPQELIDQWLVQCRSGGAVVHERMLNQEGRAGLWVEMSLKLTHIDGKPRVLAVVRDVHARHRLDEELRQADKLRALGQLAGGVAHDFNNQLTGILANAELLRLEADRNRPMNPAFVDAIIKCALRSADLTKQLLAFARKARPRREDVNVCALVQEVAEMLQRGLDPRIAVCVDPSSVPLFAAADLSLLHHALLNLGVNAKESMPNGGELHFSVQQVQLSSEQARPIEVAPGAYLEIRVRDTGTGMDAATKNQIFDPFFSTKDSGTGMGLAAAYGTVRGHGGALTVQSDPGKGSVFSVYLPALTPASQSKSESTLKALPRSSHKLVVWVVDDEPDVAHTTLHMLRALGHEPRAFGSATAALDAFAAEGTDVSLCVLDRVMPELSGDELLRSLRLLRPGLPAIFVSGYSEEHNAESAPLDNALFVQKPFGPKDLYRALATLMPNA